MKEIIIDISNEGELKIETRGYSGNECISQTKFLKELLGKEIFQELTPAYFTQQENQAEKVVKYLPICG